MSRRYLLIAATRAVLPGVVTGARRLAEVDPDAARTIVVVDGDPECVSAVAGLGDVRTGADLGITADEPAEPVPLRAARRDERTADEAADEDDDEYEDESEWARLGSRVGGLLTLVMYAAAFGSLGALLFALDHQHPELVGTANLAPAPPGI